MKLHLQRAGYQTLIKQRYNGETRVTFAIQNKYLKALRHHFTASPSVLTPNPCGSFWPPCVVSVSVIKCRNNHSGSDWNSSPTYEWLFVSNWGGRR